MTPPVYSFLASELPEKIQVDTRGKKRKLENGVKNIDLSACELFSMPQYKCEVTDRNTDHSRIRCYAIERFFRTCKDKKGTFTVETTAWEGPQKQASSSHDTGPRDSSPAEEPPRPSKPLQWSTNWNDSDSPS